MFNITVKREIEIYNIQMLASWFSQEDSVFNISAVSFEFPRDFYVFDLSSNSINVTTKDGNDYLYFTTLEDNEFTSYLVPFENIDGMTLFEWDTQLYIKLNDIFENCVIEIKDEDGSGILKG